MRVTMMLVMDMTMIVRQRWMAVFVFVLFGQVQPDADSHQGSRGDKLNCYGITQ